jgi:hypothetical protein
MDVSMEFQDDSGNALEEVEEGEDFKIVLKAEDLRSEGEKLGVFSAFADIGYDLVLTDVTEANLSDPFQSFDIDSPSCILVA